MEIKKKELIEALREINEREIFEESLPLDLTVVELKALLGEIASHLEDSDEISKETAEIILASGFALPRPVYSYIRRNPEPLPEMPKSMQHNFKILPLNWTWLYNNYKWELIQAHGLKMLGHPTAQVFFLTDESGTSFHEKYSSSLLYHSPETVMISAIQEFAEHVENLNDLHSYTIKLSNKNIKKRLPVFTDSRVRTVFLKTKDDEENVIWQMEKGWKIQVPKGYKNWLFYRIKNRDLTAKVGDELVIEPFCGAILIGGLGARLVHDFHTFMKTQDPENMISRVNAAILEDGPSPFFPGITQWVDLKRWIREIRKGAKRN